MASPFERRFIINVSAVEGQFNRDSKTAAHPQINISKAALGNTLCIGTMVNWLKRMKLPAPSMIQVFYMEPPFLLP